MIAFLSRPDIIAEYVCDGLTVTMEGFTHLIPFAETVEFTSLPTDIELVALRDLQARTE